MKRIKKIKLVLFCVLLLLGQIKISVKAENTKGELPFSLYAKAAVLMDAKSGRVLFSKEGDVPMPNASTTKILTCILAIESGRLEEKTTASAYAASMPKVHLGMETGEQFLLKDLFKGYEWNRISRSERLLLGTLFLNYINTTKGNITAIEKTSSGQQQYKKA